MTFDSEVIDPYYVSADTSKCLMDEGHCNVVPNKEASIQKNRRDRSHLVIVPYSTK